MTQPFWEKALSFLHSMLSGIEGEDPPKETTPYWIEGPEEKAYLTAKHPEVIAVSLVAGEFAQLINNRDFNSIDGKVEYHLYSEDYRQDLTKQRDEKKTVKHFKSNKIKSRCEGSRIISMRFTENLNQAEVIYSVRIVITDASDKFFKVQNRGRAGSPLGKNTPYEQLYKLDLAVEDGVWKIGKFQADSEWTVIG